MNWEALGAIGEIAGAIAVIVTLGYLALQIRQNTRQIESTSSTTALAWAPNSYEAPAVAG